MISFLKLQRTLKGKTLMDMGSEAQSDHSYISRVERGDLDVSKNKVVRYAKALDIDIDVLMVNNGYLPESFFDLRKKSPEFLTKELRKLLKKIREESSKNE